MEVCKSFVTNFLKVDRYTEPLKYTETDEACEGVVVGDMYKNDGISDTDIVIFVHGVNGGDGNEGTIAYAWPC